MRIFKKFCMECCGLVDEWEKINRNPKRSQVCSLAQTSFKTRKIVFKFARAGSKPGSFLFPVYFLSQFHLGLLPCPGKLLNWAEECLSLPELVSEPGIFLVSHLFSLTLLPRFAPLPRQTLKESKIVSKFTEAGEQTWDLFSFLFILSHSFTKICSLAQANF